MKYSRIVVRSSYRCGIMRRVSREDEVLSHDDCKLEDQTFY